MNACGIIFIGDIRQGRVGFQSPRHLVCFLATASGSSFRRAIFELHSWPTPAPETSLSSHPPTTRSFLPRIKLIYVGERKTFMRKKTTFTYVFRYTPDACFSVTLPHGVHLRGASKKFWDWSFTRILSFASTRGHSPVGGWIPICSIFRFIARVARELKHLWRLAIFLCCVVRILCLYDSLSCKRCIF